MFLSVSYPTKERVYFNDHIYRNVYVEAELEPTAIIRYRVGSNGKARERYYYQAEFEAPEDAEFSRFGKITVNIVRKKNKHFNPKKFHFENDRCEIASNK